MNPFRVIIPTIKNAGTSTVRTISGRIQRAHFEKEEVASGVDCICVWGRLDIIGVRQIEVQFTEMISMQKKSVIVDLGRVELLSSAGVGLLISNTNILHVYGKQMILLNPQPYVESVLRIGSMDQLLPIEYELSAAVRRISSASHII